MEKVLLAVDAEGSAQKAIQEVIKEIRSGAKLELHLINVQSLEASIAEAVMYIEPELYYLNKGLDAMASACQTLDQAGASYTKHVAMGDIAKAIVDYAMAKNMNRIILGRHHRGFISGLLHGSISTEVLRQSRLPVQVVPTTAVINNEQPASQDPSDTAELTL